MAERILKKAQQQQSQYQQSANGQYSNNPFGQYQQQKRTDPKVHVDYVPPKGDERKGTATAGEFVDFEEVK